MKSRILTLLALSFVLTLLTASANAAPDVYVITFTQQFGTVDLANGHFSPIGSGTPDALANLVWWGDRTLLTLTVGGANPPGSLAKIDPASGRETIIGQTGLGFNAFSLAAVRSHLYVTDFSGNLYSVDPETGVATPTAITGLPPDPQIPASYNSDGSVNLCDEGLYGIGGQLYATFDSFATGSSDPFPIGPKDASGRAHQYVSPRLYRIDPLTGATTILANTDWQITSIVEVSGNVYAFEGVLDGWNSDFNFPNAHMQIATLNPANGTTQKIADVDAGDSIGAIFGAAPVRSPLK